MAVENQPCLDCRCPTTLQHCNMAVWHCSYPINNLTQPVLQAVLIDSMLLKSQCYHPALTAEASRLLNREPLQSAPLIWTICYRYWLVLLDIPFSSTSVKPHVRHCSPICQLDRESWILFQWKRWFRKLNSLTPLHKMLQELFRRTNYVKDVTIILTSRLRARQPNGERRYKYSL